MSNTIMLGDKSTKYKLGDSSVKTIYLGNTKVWNSSANKFVCAVRAGSTTTPAYSDNGLNWVLSQSSYYPTMNVQRRYISWNGKYYAGNDTQSKQLLVSVDGINWMPLYTFTSTITSLKIIGERLYICTSSSVYYTLDGASFMGCILNLSSSGTRYISDIAYGNNTYMVTGYSASGSIFITYKSTDGITFTGKTWSSARSTNKCLCYSSIYNGFVTESADTSTGVKYMLVITNDMEYAATFTLPYGNYIDMYLQEINSKLYIDYRGGLYIVQSTDNVTSVFSYDNTVCTRTCKVGNELYRISDGNIMYKSTDGISFTNAGTITVPGLTSFSLYGLMHD